MEWDEARPWLLLVIACHDLGKACPGFQCKWKNMTDLDAGRSPNTDINHAFVSQISLAAILQKKGWKYDLAELVADAVGCHHGTRSSPNSLERLSGDRYALGKEGWAELRQTYFDALSGVFCPGMPPQKDSLSGPDFMLLAGLTSFSDWIGSNRDYFPYGHPEDCENLEIWFQQRRVEANQALNAIGWGFRTPLSIEPKTFKQVFDCSPRPLQVSVMDALSYMTEPGILLLEAPMGEGKTEAAFFAFLELQRRFGHRGLYVALPTKATGNAMFSRTLKFLRRIGTDRILDLQLLHGGGLLNEEFQELKVSGIYDTEARGGIRAGEWFTGKNGRFFQNTALARLIRLCCPFSLFATILCDCGGSLTGSLSLMRSMHMTPTREHCSSISCDGCWPLDHRSFSSLRPFRLPLEKRFSRLARADFPTRRLHTRVFPSFVLENLFAKNISNQIPSVV